MAEDDLCRLGVIEAEAIWSVANNGPWRGMLDFNITPSCKLGRARTVCLVKLTILCLKVSGIHPFSIPEVAEPG